MKVKNKSYKYSTNISHLLTCSYLHHKFKAPYDFRLRLAITAPETAQVTYNEEWC